MSRTLKVALEEWPLSSPLRITGYTFTSLTVPPVIYDQGYVSAPHGLWGWPAQGSG